MKRRAVIGIDGGGSATRVVIIGEDGKELVRGRGGAALSGEPGAPIFVEAVATSVVNTAARARVTLPAAALCAGFAGVGHEDDRRNVEVALAARGLASLTRVVTDAEAAFFDAFGDGPGLLLIGGTGSMALGRTADGRTARVGGWGLLLGDEGSGYDIGLQALRATARAVDGRGSGTELVAWLSEHLDLGEPDELRLWAAGASKMAIAALAPGVCRLAEEGDVAARLIIDKAVALLRHHVLTLIDRLGPWTTTPSLALAGGLLGLGRPLRTPVAAALAHDRCTILDRDLEPGMGAARLALRELEARTEEI